MNWIQIAILTAALSVGLWAYGDVEVRNGVVVEAINKNFDGSVYYLRPRVSVNGELQPLFYSQEKNDYTATAQTARGFCNLIGATGVFFEGEWWYEDAKGVVLDNSGRLVGNWPTGGYKIKSVTCRVAY